MVLSKLPKKSKEEKLAKLTKAQKDQLEAIEADAIANYSGNIDELEAALGVLRMGHHYGWRVLYIVHSKATIRKYEAILNTKFRDIFPEEGPSSYRSNGFRLVQKVSNFWKFISGEAPEAKAMNRETRRRVDA